MDLEAAKHGVIELDMYERGLARVKRQRKRSEILSRETLHVLEYAAEISRRKDRPSGYLDMRSHGHPVSRVRRVHKATCQWEVRYQGERARARDASSSLFQFPTSSFCPA